MDVINSLSLSREGWCRVIGIVVVAIVVSYVVFVAFVAGIYPSKIKDVYSNGSRDRSHGNPILS